MPMPDAAPEHWAQVLRQPYPEAGGRTALPHSALSWPGRDQHPLSWPQAWLPRDKAPPQPLACACALLLSWASPA